MMTLFYCVSFGDKSCRVALMNTPACPSDNILEVSSTIHNPNKIKHLVLFIN